jgi:hypothetical protein
MNTHHRYRTAFLYFPMVLAAFCLPPQPASALLYKTPRGTLKDNCVVWHDGKYYLLTMYREEVDGDDTQFNNMWLATSTDGVHWTDVGPVIHNAPFPIWAMRAWKVGNRFILNHGSWDKARSDLLRFWQSEDLVHWKYLGEQYDLRRPDGKRIDHMDALSIDNNGRREWYGYACGGLLRSEDGIKWKWKEDFRLTDKNWGVGETGGCQRIGGKFFLLGGNWQDPGLPGDAKGLPGDASYGVLTFVADGPAGPFRPDYTVLRLNGNSGRRPVGVWAGYCRSPEELLLTNYIVDPHTANLWWHAPLKKAVVDKEGHLRTGYWPGNNALRGKSLSIQPRDCTQVFPVAAGDSQKASMTVDGGAVRLGRQAGPGAGWLGYGDPKTAVALLGERLDPQKGFVLEGRMKVERLGFGRPAVGLYLEEQPGKGTAALLHTHRLTEIGKISLANDAHFDCEDRTGFGCATVAGIEAGKTCSFRLLFRRDMFEFYLDDLLVQTYYTDGAAGRVGFVVRDGQATIDNLKAWEMSLQP